MLSQFFYFRSRQVLIVLYLLEQVQVPLFLCNFNRLKLHLAQVLLLISPIFIIDGWGPDEISCTVNGKSLDKGSYKYGVEYDINGDPMTIIWLKYESDKKTDIRFSRHQVGL